MAGNERISTIAVDVCEYARYFMELGVEGLLVDFRRVEASKQVDIVPPPIVSMHKAENPLCVPPPAASGRIPGARLVALPTLGRRESPPAQPIEEEANTDIREQEAAPRPAQSDEKPASMFGDIGPVLPETSDSLESIRAEIGDCRRCPLFSGRTQIVHSTGYTAARLMFVGEAPGADEDEQGFPFVGRAGQLLTKIIESIGLRREEVFIGNINRCRPPGNRQPSLAEAETCRPFLQREIAVVRPEVIVVMGNTAAQNLLNTKAGISKIRGRFQDYFGVKLMPTFHPAYLLRDPHKKREVWEDMKKVRDYLQSR